MIVFRIQPAKHEADISGKGSLLAGGRWNLPGSSPMLYTTSNNSLAILEVLAHLPGPVVIAPQLVLLEISVPDKMVSFVSKTDLPSGWNLRGYHKTVQEWGTEWLKSGKTLGIAVPSALSLDHNILINPLHSDFFQVKVVRTIKDFPIDDRLI